MIYVGKEHALHLENVLSTNYEELSTNWSAALFCIIHLKWGYDKCTAQLSMPRYVEASLSDFYHLTPKNREHGLYPYQNTNYGEKL